MSFMKGKYSEGYSLSIVVKAQLMLPVTFY